MHMVFPFQLFRSTSNLGKTLNTSLIFLIFCICLTGCERQPPESAKSAIPKDLKYTLIENPIKISPFQLTDQNGNNFTDKQLEGKWTFVFFGYSHCPDVCPTTLMEMDDLSKLLLKSAADLKPDNSAQNIQYLFVTVDPERDTVAHLKNYIPYFNKTFTALTGPMENIDKLATEADIFHKIEKISESIAIVEHGSAIVLINPSGYYYARFDAPHYASDILATFEKIKRFYNGNPS